MRTMIQGFKMAIKSIFLNKIRSVLTMLGIIIGVAAVIVLVTVVQGQNKTLMERIESMGTNRVQVYAGMFWGGVSISDELYDFCLSMSDVAAGVTPNANAWVNEIRYRTASTASNEKYYWFDAYLGSDQFSMVNNYNIAIGRDISFLDVKSYNQVVVLGWEMKEYLFPHRDPIGERILINGQTFEVIGVYEQKDFSGTEYYSLDYMVVMPYTMSRLLNNTSEMNQFIVKAKTGDDVSVVIQRLEEFLTEKIPQDRGYFYVYSDQEWVSSMEEDTVMMSMILGGIAGISLLVGGIGIMNIMLVTVRERTREIGIRKAIGGSRKTILVQFLIEAAVVCSAGGVLGILLGYLGTVVAGKMILDLLMFPELPMTLGAFAFSVVLGVVCGMYPAIKASGLQPVEALRAE